MVRLTLLLFFFMVNLSSSFLNRAPSIRLSSATQLFLNSAADKVGGLLIRTLVSSPPQLPLTRYITTPAHPSPVFALQPVVRFIGSLDDFNDVVASGSTDGIVVIKFYASFCRACKTMAPKFRHLASNYKDEPMQFAEIELMVSRRCYHSGSVRKLRFTRCPSPTGKSRPL